MPVGALRRRRTYASLHRRTTPFSLTCMTSCKRNWLTTSRVRCTHRSCCRRCCWACIPCAWGADALFFNGQTNISGDRFLVFGVGGVLTAAKSLRNALLFNVLAYMSDRLLTGGNTVAVLDELYLWLSNPVAIEYIRNCLKRVRKRDSALIMASQNLEDFDQEGVREMTKPLLLSRPISSCSTPAPSGSVFTWTCCSWTRRSLNSSSGQGVASACISAAWNGTIWR